MDNKITHEQARYIGEAYYGTHVKARYYNGNKIPEGKPFAADEFTYIDDLGKDWHKGHLIAKSLGGLNKSWNLLPMTQTVNESDYKEIENTVSKLIEQLPEISEFIGDKDAFVQFEVTVTDNQQKYIKVSGYKFPAELTYSIRIGKGEDTPMSSLGTKRILNQIGIDVNTPLSGTIRIDKK